MLRLADDLRVYLHRDRIDFRAGINSLAILVEQAMGLNELERAVFASAIAAAQDKVAVL